MGFGGVEDVFATSAETNWPPGSAKRLGIEELRWAVLKAVGLECDELGRRRIVDVDVVEDGGQDTAESVADVGRERSLKRSKGGMRKTPQTSQIALR